MIVLMLTLVQMFVFVVIIMLNCTRKIQSQVHMMMMNNHLMTQYYQE